MKTATAIVHILPAGIPSPDDIALTLTEEEHRRAESFRFAADRIRWSGFRTQLRLVLGTAIGTAPLDVPIVLTPLGKPVLAPPFDRIHFSLSHCEDLALVAVCADGPVGVDVEPTARCAELSGCEQTFCHPQETASLPLDGAARCLRLMQIWTAKEALLKALGTGFTHPPESIRMVFGKTAIRASSGLSLPGIESMATCQLHHPSLDGYIASLSIPESVTRIEFAAPVASTSPLFRA